jgi:hypothetical protein
MKRARPATKARPAGNGTPPAARTLSKDDPTMTTTKPATLGPWTREENRVLAGSYLDMLARELRAEKYNKAAARREGLALMATYREDRAQRSAGSWEMKMCNASAVMRAAGLPWINGYKPLGHGQQRALAHALSLAALDYGWPDDDIAALEKLTQ